MVVEGEPRQLLIIEGDNISQEANVGIRSSDETAVLPRLIDRPLIRGDGGAIAIELAIPELEELLAGETLELELEVSQPSDRGAASATVPLLISGLDSITILNIAGNCGIQISGQELISTPGVLCSLSADDVSATYSSIVLGGAGKFEFVGAEPVVLRATRSIFIAAQLTVTAASCPGGEAATAADCGPGSGVAADGEGGGFGGGHGRVGDKGRSQQAQPASPASTTGAAHMPELSEERGNGGGGGSNGTTTTGGQGGDGGGVIRIVAGSVTVGTGIDASGNDGEPSVTDDPDCPDETLRPAGGGGGSGGGIHITASESFEGTGLDARGGLGGYMSFYAGSTNEPPACKTGGVGGGGRIRIDAPATDINNSLLTDAPIERLCPDPDAADYANCLDNARSLTKLSPVLTRGPMFVNLDALATANPLQVTFTGEAQRSYSVELNGRLIDEVAPALGVVSVPADLEPGLNQICIYMRSARTSFEPEVIEVGPSSGICRDVVFFPRP